MNAATSGQEAPERCSALYHAHLVANGATTGELRFEGAREVGEQVEIAAWRCNRCGQSLETTGTKPPRTRRVWP